jgi:hypothetical protein
VPRLNSEDFSRRDKQRLIADQRSSSDISDTQKSASAPHPTHLEDPHSTTQRSQRRRRWKWE